MKDVRIQCFVDSSSTKHWMRAWEQSELIKSTMAAVFLPEAVARAVAVVFLYHIKSKLSTKEWGNATLPL